MKRILQVAVLTATACTVLASDVVAQQGRRQGRGRGRNSSQQGPGAGRGVSAGKISAAERDSLVAMREEEKLARDVYTALGKVWKQPIFMNISQAESRHMRAIDGLLSGSEVKKNAGKDIPGQFTDPKVRALYQKLVAQGSNSQLDAYSVGAKIEEMDIVDLRKTIKVTTNPVIKRVLGNLERGSRNHLRAFAAQIRNLGANYKAEYLSQTEFDQIAASPMERGGGGGGGQGAGRGGQRRGGPGRGNRGRQGR